MRVDYYLVYGGGDSVIAVGICTDSKSADELNRIADAFVRTLGHQVSLHGVTEGEVVLQARLPVNG